MEAEALLLLLGGAYLLTQKRWKELREDPDVEFCIRPSYGAPLRSSLGLGGLSSQYILEIAYNPYAHLIHEAAEKHGVPDPLLISALIWVESTADPGAEGCGKNPDTRGLGLMQLTLSTARWLGYKEPREDLKEPSVNIDWASRYLGYLLKRCDSVEAALKRYRGSKKDSTNVAYANKVLGVYRNLKALPD